ncbi:MAG: FkbM family methyltransferase [Planctomycetes bacterium]|nr:FkbM family methyltransferase [Planctomycetota bacterium]
MKIHRLIQIFSTYKRKISSTFFSTPLSAQYAFTFTTRKSQDLKLKSGKTITITRRDLDAWKWFEDNNIELAISPNGEYAFEYDELKFMLRCNSEDFHVFREIFLEDHYKVKDMDFQSVVDVGGNIGLFSLAVAKRSENVVCVEPIPENIQQIEQHMSINNITNVKLLRAAASDTANNQISIYINSTNTGGHSMFKNWAADQKSTDNLQEVIVNTVDLNTILIEACNSVDYFKCDIEGSEFQLFKNSAPSSDSVAKLCLEIHISNDESIKDYQTLLNHFKQSHYYLSDKGDNVSCPSNFILHASSSPE